MDHHSPRRLQQGLGFLLVLGDLRQTLLQFLDGTDIGAICPGGLVKLILADFFSVRRFYCHACLPCLVTTNIGWPLRKISLGSSCRIIANSRTGGNFNFDLIRVIRVMAVFLSLNFILNCILRSKNQTYLTLTLHAVAVKTMQMQLTYTKFGLSCNKRNV